MPSKLIYFGVRKKKVDGFGTILIPKSKWKGKGYYYNRGGDRGWTKYSRALDKKRGKGIGTGNRRHETDKIRKKKR